MRTPLVLLGIGACALAIAYAFRAVHPQRQPGIILGDGRFVPDAVAQAARVRRRPHPGERWTVELTRAGLPKSPLLLSGISLGFAVVVYVLVATLFTNQLVAVLYATLSLYLPWAYVRYRARQNSQRYGDLMPEFIQSVSREIAGNRPIDEAVEMQATKGPEDLRPFVAAFRRKYRDTGDFATSLRSAVRDPLALPEVDAAVESLVIAQPRGTAGKAMDMLADLAAHLRWSRAQKLKARTEMKRNLKAVHIGLAVPWLALFLFSRPNPETLATPGGTAVMLYVALSGIGGWWVSRRIMRIPLDSRVLAAGDMAGNAAAPSSLPARGAADSGSRAEADR